MSGSTLRREFTKKFKTLSKPSRIKSTFYIASYVGQILASIAAGAWIVTQGFGIWTCLGAALLMLFIGTRFRGLNNIVHECSHFTFSRDREDNIFMGKLSCAFLLKSFEDYRKEHMTHHAHLGDYDRDLDFQNIRDFGLEEPLTPKTLTKHALVPLFGLHLPYYLGMNLRVRDGMGFAIVKMALIVSTAAFTYLNPVAGALFVLIPFFWIYSALNYWTDVVDHGGLLETGDELEASRNIILPRAIRAILFPRNDCYHLIHHLFPHVPVEHFDQVHEELMEHPAYRERMERKQGDAEAKPATA
jgi:fatty acid desaturase